MCPRVWHLIEIKTRSKNQTSIAFINYDVFTVCVFVREFMYVRLCNNIYIDRYICGGSIYKWNTDIKIDR